MATLQLKSNTLELLCRACLKMKKTHFNIFEQKQNDQLLADMIMDCTSIKVQKNDGFPVNICDECIIKLDAACNFKAMIINSYSQLHKFYASKTTDKKKSLLNENENVIVKQEFLIKIEQSELSDGALRKESMVDIKGLSSSDSPSNKKNLGEGKCNVSTCKNANITYNQQVIKDDTSEKVDALDQEYYKIEPQYVSLDNNDFCDSLDSFTNNSDQSSTDHIKGRREKSENTKQTALPIKLKDQRENIIPYENQAALLDNPDYQRIINSGLTKKEKDRATVFCGECKKSFSFRYYVAIHATTHTGHVPYKCDKCGKCYPKPAVLKAHLLSHSQTRNFACDECGKAFFRKQQMQYHKASKHSDERPFKCTTCEKTFKIYSGLRQHVLTHANARSLFVKFVAEVSAKR